MVVELLDSEACGQGSNPGCAIYFLGGLGQVT